MLRRPGTAGGTCDADEALPAMPAAAHVALLSAFSASAEVSRSMEGGFWLSRGKRT